MTETLLGEVSKPFQVLLKGCLRADSTDELTVIFDESLTPFADSFFAEALRLDLSVTPIFVSHAEQIKLSSDIGSARPLPAGILAAISASTAIITFLSPSTETLAFRRAVINHPRPGNCRLAHIPGLSVDVLQILVDSPIDEIYARCERLAWALGDASRAAVTTVDRERGVQVLTLNLGSWSNEPLMSPGVIVPGTWGNIPPGESFICPILPGTTGTVVIDGSIPGHVIPDDGSGFRLTFVDGRLSRYDVIGTFPGADFFSNEEVRALQNEDSDWNVLAEFGIGANPIITQLTGNMLFDEKALNTAHVAIGDNTVFGHDYASRVHHDLIMRRPTVVIDDYTLMDTGTLLDPTIARERGEDALLSSAGDACTIIPRMSRIRVRTNAIDRRLQSGDRVGYVCIAEGPFANALVALIEELSAFGAVSLPTVLRKCPVFGGYRTSHLISVLSHYRMVTLQEQTNRQQPT